MHFKSQWLISSEFISISGYFGDLWLFWAILAISGDLGYNFKVQLNYFSVNKKSDYNKLLLYFEFWQTA